MPHTSVCESERKEDEKVNGISGTNLYPSVREYEACLAACAVSTDATKTALQQSHTLQCAITPAQRKTNNNNRSLLLKTKEKKKKRRLIGCTQNTQKGKEGEDESAVCTNMDTRKTTTHATEKKKRWQKKERNRERINLKKQEEHRDTQSRRGPGRSTWRGWRSRT